MGIAIFKRMVSWEDVTGAYDKASARSRVEWGCLL